MSKTAPTLATRAPHVHLDRPFNGEQEIHAILASEISGTGAGPPDALLDSGAIAGWIEQLREVRRDVSDTERIDQIHALERLKAAAAAAQARITVDMDASVRATHAAAGMPADRQGRGVAAQVALARQESPYRGTAPAPPGHPPTKQRRPGQRGTASRTHRSVATHPA